ncbi:MAG TPA: hypothetical protein VGV93_05435 [Acidimicrobiales bacterium]|nr:hypothetical protein [Acidimicrobiales bacterium]
MAGWREQYLLPRLTAKPSPLALPLVAGVDDPSLHLYPSAINAHASDVWALRLDGLQIGTASATSAKLTIGKPGKGGDGPQRRAFTAVFGGPSVVVSTAKRPPPGQLSVDEATDGIRRLLRRFREVDVRGAPISHRVKAGIRVIDEHTLEARLLNGLARLGDTDGELVLDDVEVARGSQFPTLWGHGGDARYLDALVRRGATPVAVELKVATGGQGRYYRRSLVQAVLYRHFIRNAPGLEKWWFQRAGLDRMATEGCIGVPIPGRWTQRFSRDLERLKGIAEMVGAQVHVLDDRVTPDWVATEGLPEPALHEAELLSWRMAAALSSRWPKSLGRMVERHECGGFYDQIQLQDLADRTLALPSPRPRIALNRPGSLWVFSQTGSVRWTWREIWSFLAHGGDPGEAAVIVGGIAGLGMKEVASGPCFAEVALGFVEAAQERGWSWRCAWPDSGEVSGWIERYKTPLARYKRSSVGAALPTIARIWGAVRDGEAAVIVDQQNLCTWVWVGGEVREVGAGDPLERIATAAELVVA